MDKVNVLGVGVDPVHLEELLVEINRLIQRGDRALIAHVNIRALNLAYEDRRLSKFLNSCDRVFCDGMGVQLGAAILGKRIPQRFTLADWIWPLAKMGAKEDLGFFFLGNPPGVAHRAAEVLRQEHLDLKIESQHGFFNRVSESVENEVVINKINASGVNILLVGFGMPEQEHWLKENWSRLDVNIGITCGALFEYISGDLQRGPRWMTDNYLEWFWRMIKSPGRYSKRYLRDIPLFTYRIARQRWSGVERE